MEKSVRPRLEARLGVSRTMVYATPVMALLLTMAFGSILFAALGQHPPAVLYAFFVQPISSAYGLAELTVKATPLVLCAIGLSFGFRANIWNIGAEGQLTLGAIAGGGVALWAGENAGPWVLPAMMLAGLLGGAAWAAIPAYLKTRFNANEILTSLMLTYVALLLLSYLVHGPWKDPQGYSFPQSRMFADSALLPLLTMGTRLHLGAPVALFVALAAWWVMARMFIGFQIKVVGLTPAAAGLAGFSVRRLTWITLLTGGALAGLAGLFEVAGPIGQLLPSISPGYGFTAIIVAFLGRLHPVGILLAGLLIALSYLGGETVQIELGLPLAVAGVFQGMLLFFLLATDVLVRYRIRWGRKVITQEAG
ncbi:MAG: ABC transporter permease [Rhodospirillaceae bacterium]|nr:ABC transporter permease [Rhodospirillaceae bacterium]MBT4043838.1 ABC transporter permease [Rhodospirillaceae bacterium]MBT4691147.1 ABC transporter permease [Rhodospirillaceae bacterium]MBT5080900.1 ABC transporter permease [Rhodospirillaceae bacterium]MBT5525321.1 ABC transporter permease [Rhodospirillaceae bacterium]